MNPRLSVIIVNYNVAFFLEQCLQSVRFASERFPVEVIVVDNNSRDNSVSLVEERFPEVKLIANKDNRGFSKANNQGIEESSGEYVLLLNPDTVIEQDTFSKVIEFMDKHPDAGGLGVKMIDGKGNFLPESKRGLPTPWVAFFKVFGFSALFPKSKLFGRYHLGFLDRDEVNEVDVLSGAFMLLRKETLDKTGLLDETFFMYGEDIDLSYRVQLAGYKNYYFPETSIIHYKGESTKKSSINYVFVFYRAMIIFAKKHFSGGNAAVFSTLINMAIYLRAALAIVRRFWNRSYPAIIDFALIYIGLWLVSGLYENYSGKLYPEELLRTAFPLFSGIWVGSIFFSGGYDEGFSLRRFFVGFLVGSMIILAAYGLLDESQRFSRAVVLLGAGYFALSAILVRLLYNLLGLEAFQSLLPQEKRILIIGSFAEFERVKNLLEKTKLKADLISRISPSGTDEEDANEYVGKLEELKENIEMFKANEVIFCSQDLGAEIIIRQMSHLEEMKVDFKIAPPAAAYVIGSNSINTSGELYSVLHLNSISKPSNKRVKRTLDFVLSIIFLSLSPLLFWFQKKKSKFFGNLFQVLIGERSFVGYSTFEEGVLPPIRKGVLNPSSALVKQTQEEERRLDLIYAKNYSVRGDFNIILRAIRFLGK